MSFESVPPPIKIKAKGIALREFSGFERRLLRDMRFSGPRELVELSLWHRYLRVLARESNRLLDPNAWSTPDLLGLLSDGQKRALTAAKRHLSLDHRRERLALQQAFPIVMRARSDAMAGIRNRETHALTHWTEWERLLDGSG